MEELEGLSKLDLIRIILRLEERVKQLEAELAKARKDSSNSSKPPSSDIVKPPKGPKGKKGKRKIGGQPGHARHERRAFAPGEVDEVVEHALDRCPRCGGRLSQAPEAPRVIQQAELVERPIRVVEHRALAHWCSRCGKVRRATLPQAVKRGGLLGARLTAMLTYLKGGCHLSYSDLKAFLADVLGARVCRGYLAKQLCKASAALAKPYTELRAALSAREQLNVDETGHKDSGKRMWTWCFSAPEWTVFRVVDSRGAKVLGETLGDDFVGVIGCDYFSAYRKYARETDAAVQFCWAHMVRDVKFLTTLPDRVTRNYGERVLKAVRKMFQLIHRREAMKPENFQRALERQADYVLRTVKRAPPRTEARNLAKRFKEHAAEYFRFVSTPGVAPTNNAAERALRFVVIQRRMTQGTRGEAGRTWSERIWTAASSCAKQGRSLYDYLHQALLAHLNDQVAPSLLPENP